MVTKREQMRIVAIHTMSMCSLVSDGLVLKIALAKSIFMKKMAMSRAGHCQTYLNLFKILEALPLPLQNLVSKILVKSLQAVQVFRLALKWSMMSLIWFFFSVKTKTELLEQRRLHLPVSTPDFKIGNVNISVIKQGPLHKTKLLENGKKQRKNWNVAHIVLTDTFLLFFKDAKSFANLQSGNNSKPDFCIDLKGAIVDWCSSEKSKRSNVFEVSSAILGTTVLLQDDSLAVAAEWFQEIQKIIENLNTSPKSRRSSDTQSNTLQLPASKKANKVGRTKSLKMKILGMYATKRNTVKRVIVFFFYFVFRLKRRTLRRKPVTNKSNVRIGSRSFRFRHHFHGLRSKEQHSRKIT